MIILIFNGKIISQANLQKMVWHVFSSASSVQSKRSFLPPVCSSAALKIYLQYVYKAINSGA